MPKHWMKRQAGQAVILVAITVVLLTALLMLALDGGSMYLDRRQLQNAADAAALAGAEGLMGLPPSAGTMHTSAMQILVKNLPGTAVPSICTPCPSQPAIPASGLVSLGAGYSASLSITSLYTYQVTVQHAHQVVVAPVHGFGSTVTLQAQATAQNGNLPYAVVLLQDNPTGQAPLYQYANLSINGVGSGGTTGLALTNVAGVTGGRGGVFTNESMDTGTGTISFTPGCTSRVSPGAGDLWAVNEAAADAGRVATQTTGCSPMPSPYPRPSTHIPYPSYPEPPYPNRAIGNPNVGSGQTVFFCPALYTAQLSVQATGTAILLPGVYRFQVNGVSVGGTLRTLQAGDFPIPAASVVGGCTAPASWSGLDPGVILEVTPGNAAGSTLCNKHLFATTGGSSSISLARSPQYYNINIYIESLGGVPGSPGYPCTQNPMGTNVVSITGGGSYIIPGIIYGPFDNMKINGSGAGSGVGQIVAWTLTIGGNGLVNETFDPSQLPWVKGLVQ